MVSVRLSPHFTLAELTTTAHPTLQTSPGTVAAAALRTLATDLLEGLRAEAGGYPLAVTSGFRSAAVNAAVGGSRTSQHLRGEAADLLATYVPGGRPVLWGALVSAVVGRRLLVDQAIIYENAPHIHVSYTGRYPNRAQLLVHTDDGRYVSWATYRGILR